MDKVDIVIIGAGVVGLAIAERLARSHKEIVVLERHDSFGQESSSRNSEVLHAGIYYPTNSLKAKLCVKGNRRLFEIAQRQSIPVNKIGKLIIATNEKEEEKLHELKDLGTANDVQGLSLLSKNTIKEVEPAIKSSLALYSPETGIIDTHQLMKCFETVALQNGTIIAYNCTVTDIDYNSSFVVSFLDADGEVTKLQSEMIINCSGLSAGAISEMAGIDIEKEHYCIYPCKGEYFNVSNRHKNKLRYLIYPAPTPISLGIHTVIDMNQGLKLGPNAFYVDEVDYDVDPLHREEFFASAKTYLPFLEPEDLSPAMAGCRAKIQSPGEGFCDFIIRDETDKGLPGFINLVGFESPGLTSSPAIAEYVEELINSL